MKTIQLLIFAPISIFFIIFIGIFLFFKPLVEYGLKSADLGYITFEKAFLRVDGATLTNIKLDESGSVIGKVSVYATADDLLKKKIQRILIEDARINPLTALRPKSENASKEIRLFAQEAEFKNVILDITTPFGVLPLTMNGSLTDKGAEYQLSVAVEGKADFVEVAGQLTAKIGKTDEKISAHLELAEAKALLPDIDMKRIAGWISADITAASPLPVLNAQLTAGSVKLFGLPLQGTTFSVSSTPEKTQVILTGQAQNDSGEISADITLDQTGKETDKLSAKVDATLKNLEALQMPNLEGQGSFNLLASGEKEKASSLGDMTQWKNLKGYASLQAQKLSLQGLVNKAVASGKLELDFDPTAQLLSVKTFEGPFSFKGILLPLDSKPVSILVPEGIAAWNAKEKSLKTVLIGADISGALFTAKKATTDLTAWLGGDAPVLEGKISIGEIAHNAKPAYVVPLRLSAQFQSLSSQQYTTGFSGEVSEKNGLLYAKFQGKHDAANNKGDMSLSMPPVTLREGVTSLAQVFPVSAVYMQDAFGTFGLSVKAAWSKQAEKWQTTSSGELYLKQFTATYDANTVTDMNAVLKLDSLSPPVFTNQTIGVGELFIGLPLTNGVMNASLDAKNNLALSRMEWDMAGGKISAAPFTLPLDTMATDVTLSAKGIDIAQLFAIAPTEGLAASGAVNGTLPLSVRKDSVTINNGVLETTGTGTISYAVENMPAFLKDATNPQILDLRTALTQFHYDSLKMILNGEAGKDQKIQLQIKGRNPLFYKGRQVNFNLNLEGPLQNILKYKPGGGHIPDSIRTQLEAYEKKHGN